MKALEFTGIIPPLQTAFDPDGRLDQEAMRSLIEFVLPHCQALYPIGTYGCGPLMSLEERREVLEFILETVNGRVPVIAHVGTPDTRTTVELAKHAKAAGAAAVGAISPYYAPGLPDDNIFRHFAALVDAVNEEEFPVFVYNNHHYSQNKISPAVLRRLAEHGLRGCKDSAFDYVNFLQFQEAVADYPDFNLIIGTEAFFVAAFDMGATGCVCGMANVYPDLLAKLYASYTTGDRQEANRIQREILKLRAITKAGPTVPILHAILELRGVTAGHPRAPYYPVSDAIKQTLATQLKELGLL